MRNFYTYKFNKIKETGFDDISIIEENGEIVEITQKNLSKCADTESGKCEETLLIKDVKNQLEEYFEGKRKKFNVPFKFKGTDFQKSVWKELTKIPYGNTLSYSDIATKIRKPNSQRAVGNACNKNPLLIIVPCHRVKPKSGAIGGFAIGSNVKEKLLSLETEFV